MVCCFGQQGIQLALFFLFSNPFSVLQFILPIGLSRRIRYAYGRSLSGTTRLSQETGSGVLALCFGQEVENCNSDVVFKPVVPMCCSETGRIHTDTCRFPFDQWVFNRWVVSSVRKALFVVGNVVPIDLQSVT